MKTNLAKLIEEAFDECIIYGRGRVNDKQVSIVADWAENEKDIEINILEDGIVLFAYIEKGVF